MKIIYKIISLAFLSLLLNGEYLAHGLGIFQNTGLIFFYLTFVSFLYFSKRKFNLSYKKLFLLGATIGLLIEGIVTKSIFSSQPLILGINPLAVLLQIFTWGLLASVLPLYLTEKQKINRSLLILLGSYILLQVIVKTFFTGLVDIFYFVSVVAVSIIIIKKGYIKT